MIHVLGDLGDATKLTSHPKSRALSAEEATFASRATSLLSVDLLSVLPLILGKCVISCVGAVHAEYFLQHGDVRQMPLWVTQVHFKAATMLGAIALGVAQGSQGGRIFAQTWRGDLFVQLPAGARVDDPRTPFFGGWDANTWMLLGFLVLNNFLVGDQLRKLSSVSKYVAYSFGLVFSYSAQLWNGSRQFDPIQAGCCCGIAVIAIAYVWAPSSASKSPGKDIKDK